MTLPPLDPRDPAFWSRENALLYDDIDELLLAIYLAGAAGGEGAMPAGAALLIDWTVINDDALLWLRNDAVAMVEGITDTTRRAVVGEINDWVQSGSPFPALIKRLRMLPQLDDRRAKTIGITEVTRIYGEGNMAAWKSTGMVGAKKWQTAQDERVCPICGPLHGKVVEIDGQFGLTADEVKGPPSLLRQFNKEATMTPPAHPNCLLPGNEVVIPGNIKAATKSFHDGPAVEITTASGRSITVTENHPILTRGGWVAAGKVIEGIDLITSPNAEGVAALINPDAKHVPASIEKKWDAFHMSSSVLSVSVPPAAKHFHGDGKFREGNIDIVFVDSPLIHRVNHGPSTNKGLHRSGEPISLVGLGALNSLSMWDVTTPRSFISRRNLGGPLACGHSSPLGGLGLTLPTRLNTGFKQSLAKGPAVDPSLASEFVLRFASDITFDKVVKVRNFNYSGHVYNLHVDPYELYFTNGIVTSNCRCWLLPVVSQSLVRGAIRDVLAANELIAEFFSMATVEVVR